MKKKILYLSHRIPYPPNKGDKIRSFNEIKELSDHYTIDLICLADDPKDLKYSKDLLQYCRQVKVFPLNPLIGKLKGLLTLITGKSITQGYFYKAKFQKQFDQWIDSENYDAVIFFSSSMAEYFFKSSHKEILSQKQLIMDFCDLDSDKWRQYAQKTKFPLKSIYNLEGSRLLEFEIKINKVVSQSVFVSSKEAKLFLQYYPDASNVNIISNGVDHEFFNPESVSTPENITSPMIAFFGAMDYYANVDGVLWFAEKILPIVKKAVPDIMFYIVGSNPDKSLKNLEGENIKVTGFVDDIREYYMAADICVIPLRIARGVQNKVLEAMSMGRPIVSTPAAVQGISEYNDLPLDVKEKEKEFAEAVIELLKNKDKSKELGKSARSFVLKHFHWKKNMDKLKVY